MARHHSSRRVTRVGKAGPEVGYTVEDIGMRRDMENDVALLKFEVQLCDVASSPLNSAEFVGVCTDKTASATYTLRLQLFGSCLSLSWLFFLLLGLDVRCVGMPYISKSYELLDLLPYPLLSRRLLGAVKG